MTAVRVVRAGFLAAVQDRGRWGFEHWGVPVSGVLDDYACQWANWLLSNPVDAAVLEIAAVGPELEVVSGGTLAWTGAEFEVTVDGEEWPSGEARLLGAGAHLRFGRRRRGLRSYLAFPGGIDVPVIMGSRATDLGSAVGGFLGRPLVPGDYLSGLGEAASLGRTERQTVRLSRTLRVLPGARLDRFSPHALTRLATQPFRVSDDSSAVGLRLTGATIDQPRGDWPSEGMAIGSIEVPPSGEPLVLLTNRGSIGGYPVVAHVIRADWPALAQLAPGDSISFALVNHEQALAAFQEMQSRIGRAANLRQTWERAPFAGVIIRSDHYGRHLADAGEWVHKNQLLARIESMGQVVPLYAGSEGLLTEIVAKDTVVDKEQTLWVIQEEVDAE